MRNRDHKVGLVAGSFDLWHPGYIRLFRFAKDYCDYLIVALHEDPSVERSKTKYPPVFTREERLEMLMALRYVDEVHHYKTENDLLELILEIKPDVRILGSDYIGKRITGKTIVPVVYHVRNHNFSNTVLRKLIFEAVKRHNRRK